MFILLVYTISIILLIVFTCKLYRDVFELRHDLNELTTKHISFSCLYKAKVQYLEHHLKATGKLDDIQEQENN